MILYSYVMKILFLGICKIYVSKKIFSNLSTIVWEYLSVTHCWFVSSLRSRNSTAQSGESPNTEQTCSLAKPWSTNDSSCILFTSQSSSWVKQTNKQIFMLLLKICSIVMTCRLVAHKMWLLYAGFLYHCLQTCSLTGMTSIMQIFNRTFPGFADNAQRVSTSVSWQMKNKFKLFGNLLLVQFSPLSDHCSDKLSTGQVMSFLVCKYMTTYFALRWQLTDYFVCLVVVNRYSWGISIKTWI